MNLNSLSGEGLLLAGEVALLLNKLDRAQEFAQAAVLREADNPDAAIFLSKVMVLNGQVTEALQALEQTVPSVRQVFTVAFERARLIHQLHGAQTALETLERLAQEYPESPDLLAFLAQVQSECGDLRAAERHALKSLRLNSEQPDLAFMLGRLQHKSGQLDQAVHLLSEAIRMSPDQLEAYLELGTVYQERREFPQALQIYQQAVRVAPDDYQAYYQAGLLLRDGKDYAAAENMLRSAADMAPENLGIRRQLVAVITLNLVHNKQEVNTPA